MDFTKRYAKLNTNQKQAVDLIDGPVMVIAGPGTGKTELLALRTANILRQTDTSPENILCLTYTESGVNAMRQRLISTIGADAHKVGIHTFHGFCADIINQNPDYFYNGAVRKLADKITINEILTNIFAKLPHNDPMASTNNGQFTQIKLAQNTISDIKRSGLSPDELSAVLDANDQTIDLVEPLIAPVFEQRMAPKLVPAISALVPQLANIKFECNLPGIVPLGQALADSLQNAVDEAEATGKTTPISNWKTDFTEKDDAGNRVLKSRSRQVKLRSICNIYQQYIQLMDTADVYDYDDMILQAIQKIEQHIDLKLNLQEKYQYIMVDEFQDTNMSQMRILHNLTDNIVNEGMPNILVVGDDDQAIYSFQGATISNILDFKKTYPKSAIITLGENYRSNEHILATSRAVIIQSVERLENKLESVNKKLNANHTIGDGVSLHQATTINDENYWIADNIQQRLDAGEKPSEIAIIARSHQQIIDILPYLYHAGISVNYEKSNNALDQEPIIFIEKIAQMLVDLSNNQHASVNAKLPEILSHSAWRIDPVSLWELGVKAYNDKNQWLQQMQKMTVFAPIFEWMVQTAAFCVHMPLENILDIIIGLKKPTEDSITSPLYQYYFSENELTNDPEKYITYLESLRAIRRCTVEHQPETKPNLATFVRIIQSYHQIGEPIKINQDFSVSDKSINLMTAHSAKGLEFNTVYILDATNDNWNKNRGGRGNFSYPENLQIGRAGDSTDEKTRLFFVAMTRAKHQLHICYSLQNDRSKPASLSAFLVDNSLTTNVVEPREDILSRTESAQLQWYQPLVSPITADMRDILKGKLDNYKLNPTALNNFIDLENCGPEQFLLNNLLHFPQSQNPFTTYGNCIHETMKNAHSQLTGKTQIKSVVDFFVNEISKTHLDEDDIAKYTAKGTDSLAKFFTDKPDFFNSNQKSEENFGGYGCVVGDAVIGGKIDLMDINPTKKLVTVIDYKTGKQFDSWDRGDSRIKAHKYRQQLMFYKLLIETSSKYRDYQADHGTIQFVEPNKSGQITDISLDFDQSEIDEFIKLINAVYKKIVSLDLPDTSNYTADITGIRQFESDLIENKI